MASLTQLKTLLETTVNDKFLPKSAQPLAHKWISNIKSEFIHVLKTYCDFFRYDDVCEKDIYLMMCCVTYNSKNGLTGSYDPIETRKTWIDFTIKNRLVVQIKTRESNGTHEILEYNDLQRFLTQFTTFHMSGIVYKDMDYNQYFVLSYNGHKFECRSQLQIGALISQDGNEIIKLIRENIICNNGY